MVTKIIIIMCQNDTIYKEWLIFINYFKGDHAQTQFWSKFEITKCGGDLEHNAKFIILNSLNAHNLPIFQPILMILVSKFVVHSALSDKTYLL